MANASVISLSSYSFSLSSMLRVEEEEGLVCGPLRTLKEVKNFIKNPPVWRSLCVELKPHSEYAIRNMDIVKQNKSGKDFAIEVTAPETFCHFDPSHEDVAHYKRKSLPKTLVCHDMANGYHDDCKVDGTFNYEAYTFYNWAAVDIFCYFSHHFVTIPPLGWINVGHEHGVKVIGTIITEWAVGAQLWDAILSTPREWQEFASFLVTIAKTLKFDGWLLNVENMVKQPETLLLFVQHLHSLMHRELHEPVLLWYDSVNTNGELLWQNALNERNKPFFDACDGIFTNYAWSENDVQASRAAAGERHRDVFVGVDVWGRNFIGGGQFNTQEALKIIYKNDCSVALFAPAWTHEALDDEQWQISTVGRQAELGVLDSFLLRERALWGSLWPYLNTKLPSTLPFQTSFCKGQGKKRRLYGEVLGSGAWYNLRHQCYQPNAAHGPHAYLLSSTQALLAVHAHGLQSASDAAKLRETFRARDKPQLLQRPKSAEPGGKVEPAKPTERAKSATPDKPAERTKSAPPDKQAEHTKSAPPAKPANRAKSATPDKPAERPKSATPDKPAERPESASRAKPAGRANSATPGRPTDRAKSAPPAKPAERADSAPPGKPARRAKSATPDKPGERAESVESDKPAGPAKPVERANSDPAATRLSFKDKFKYSLRKTFDSFRWKRNKRNAPIGSLPDESASATSSREPCFRLRTARRPNRNQLALVYVANEAECLEVYLKDSYNGGSCLAVHPGDEMDPRPRFTRLLHCDFKVDGTLVACVVTKRLARAPEQALAVELRVREAAGAERRVLLAGAEGAPAGLAPLDPAGPQFKSLQNYLLLREPDFYVAVENSYGWDVRYYEAQVRGRVTSVNCRALDAAGPILLGHFGLCERNEY